MTVDRTGCGEPRVTDAGDEMTVYGWVDRRRDHGGLIFLDLRDHSGILQVVINPQTAPQAHHNAHGVRLEYVMRVHGTLRAREPHNVNPRRDTGEVELYADECEVLSVASTPPFPVNEEYRRRGGLAPALPIPRPASCPPAAQPAQPRGVHRRAPRRHGRAWASRRSRRR